MKTYGYAYWHRLALMPGIDVCPTHASTFLTLCAGCETKNHMTSRVPWQPGHRCHCGGRLRAVRNLSKTHLKAELSIAKMVQQLLTGEFRPRTMNGAFAQRVRDQCTQNAVGGNSPAAIFNEMLHDKLGVEYLTKIRLGPAAQARFIADSGGIPTIEPLVNIGAAYAVFCSWQGYEESTKADLDELQLGKPTPTVDGAECMKAEQVRTRAQTEQPRTRAQEYMKGYMKTLSMTAYKEHFLELTEEQRVSYKQEARQWLREILKERPDITRTSLAVSKKTNRFFAFLKLFDKEYLCAAIPRSKPTLWKVDVEKRIEHVYARRAFLLAEFPGLKITSSFLLEGLFLKASDRGSKEVRDAIRNCKDTVESYYERLVPILCGIARSIQASSRYCDEKTYRSSEGKLCRNRIAMAKQWLKRSIQSVTAHSYLFPEQRRRGQRSKHRQPKR
ncbi:hypothetical protein [Paraburkholderia xenovorans]|nr:hypothetical protein [Paraburkholderia xenovorans]